VRLLPGASTTLNNRISLPTFSGVTHISIIASADTTHQHLQQIQHVEKRLRYENPAHREFRIIAVPDRDNPEVETRFIISFPPNTPLAHRSDEPPDRPSLPDDSAMSILSRRTPRIQIRIHYRTRRMPQVYTSSRCWNRASIT